MTFSKTKDKIETMDTYFVKRKRSWWKRFLYRLICIRLDAVEYDNEAFNWSMIL